MKNNSQNPDPVLFHSRKAQTPSNQNYNNQSQFKNNNNNNNKNINFYADLNPSQNYNAPVQKHARSMTFNAVNNQNQNNQLSTQQPGNSTTLLASKSKLGSIYRGVRKGDLTEILGPKASNNKNFLPQIQKGNKSVSNNDGTREFIFEERDTMQKEKVKIRKELDKWLYEINCREKEISRLKKDNEDFRRKLDFEKNQGNFIQLEKGVIKENGLQSLEQKHLFWKKTKYEFMKNRLSKDSIVYKFRQNTIEEEIKLIDQEIKKLQEQLIRIKEFNGNSERIVHELQLNLIATQKQKEEEIEKLLLSKDQDNFKEAKSHIRQQNQKVQADVVKFGKTPQEEKYRHFYFCNKLAKQILQSKMNRLLKQYDQVEKVFLKIKAATGTQSIYDILEIFIERDELYQSLQSQIQNNSENSSSIDKTIDSQNKYIKELMKERENLQNQLKKPHKDQQQQFQDLQKQYEQVVAQSQFNEVQEQKLYNWVVTNLTRLDKIQGIDLEKYLTKSQVNQTLQVSNNPSKINEVSNEQESSMQQTHPQGLAQGQPQESQLNQQNNSKNMQSNNASKAPKTVQDTFNQENIVDAFQLLSELILKNVKQVNQEGSTVDTVFKNIQNQDNPNALYQQQPQFFQKNTRIDLEKQTETFLKSQTKQKNFDIQSPQNSESLGESSNNFNSNMEDEEINHMELMRQKVQLERQQLLQQRKFEEERQLAEKKKKEESQNQ